MTGWLDGAQIVMPPAAPAPEPPPTFGEAFDAARKSYDALDLTTTNNLYAGRIGRDVVAALRAKGRTGFTGADGRKIAYGDDALRSDYILNPTVAPRIWQDIAAERARDPGFLKGLGTPEEFRAAVLAARKKDYQESAAVLGRAEGVSGLAAQLAGGLAGAANDPLQIGIASGSLPFGGPVTTMLASRLGVTAASSAAKRIGVELLADAGLNIAATVPTLPVKAANADEIGVDYGAGDMAADLGVAGVFGVAVSGGLKLTGAAARGVASLPGKLVDSPVTARMLLKAFGDIKRPLTPDEAAARTVLEAEVATLDSSPFPPTQEGESAHIERLTEAVDALENDRPMRPEVFDTPVADLISPVPVLPDFDPTPHLGAAAKYVADRNAGPLTREAVGAALGLAPEEADAVLSRLASGSSGIGLRQQRIFEKVPGQRKRQLVGVKWTRARERRGPQDVLTVIGDAGGIIPSGVAEGSTSAGHDLAGTLGRKFIPGAGPLLRKSGMTIDELGEFLHERGWFPGEDRPTEADVLDLLDRAMREKVYHPDDAPDIADADAAAANDQWAADMRERLAIAAEDLGLPPLAPEDANAILPKLAAGMEPMDAIEQHIDDLLTDAVLEARATLDQSDYEAAFFGDGYDPAGQIGDGAADGGGRAVAPGDTGQGAARGGDAGSLGGRTADGRYYTDNNGNPIDDYGNPIDPADLAAGAEALKDFDEPGGAGAVAQRESLEHDIRAEMERVNIGPSTAPNQIELGQAADAAADPNRFNIRDGMVTTLTGRQIKQFPKIRLDSERKTANDLKALDNWLVTEARAEALARADDFNGPMFERMNPKRISDGDRSVLNEYLFGDPEPVWRMADDLGTPPIDAGTRTPSTEQGFEAWQAATDAVTAVIDELAMKQGRDLFPDASEAAIDDIAMIVMAGGDAEAAARKALAMGQIKAADVGVPVAADVKPLPPSDVVSPPPRTVTVDSYAGPKISAEEAAARLDAWKAEAKRIGQTKRDGEIVISLFDASGVMSEPWRDMGFEVYQLDLKLGDDLLRDMPRYVEAIQKMQEGGARIVGVLAQPPCTTFAGSGARWWSPRHDKAWQNAVGRMWGDWARKEFQSPVEYNQALVAATEEMIAVANAGFFVIENPVGRIEKMTGLPKPRLVMQPHNFGDPYTKRTSLYGEFNDQLPTANVEPTEGSRMHKLRSTDEKDGGLRSLTSEPFAYAFALANAPNVELSADLPGFARGGGEAVAPPIGDTATGSLGLDAVQAASDGMTEAQRAEMAARLQQLRIGRLDQKAVDQIEGGLFDARRDQMDIFALPDGRTASTADLIAEFNKDDAALKIIKDCL